MGIFGEKCEGCGSRTHSKDEFGRAKCGECQYKEKVKKEMEAEKIQKCPIDGADMKKECYEDIIIDRCPKCNGIWLDGGELEAIKKHIEDDADSGPGFGTGLVLGMAMG